jgi:hypothetical protein
MVAAAGLAVVASGLVAPAFADPMKDGMMEIVMPNGDMKSMPVPADKVQDMIKMAKAMDQEMAIFVWGSKFYVVKNEKMPSGQMSFDVWGIKATK